MSTCRCHPLRLEIRAAAPRSHLRSGLALVLSLLVAFFPKCPMCWAACSSAMGIAGIAQGPYLGLLFPVLLVMLGVHLLFLLKHVRLVGYGPLLLSVVGASAVLIARQYSLSSQWPSNFGILLIFTGSIWSNFSVRRRANRNLHKTDPKTVLACG